MAEKIASFNKRKNVSGTLVSRLNNWKMKADEFYRASEYLWIELNKDYLEIINRREKGKTTDDLKPKPYTPSLHHPYFLLISLSIENLLKGIVLFNNSNLLTNKLHNSIKTHDLNRISKFITIKFLKREVDFFLM